MGKTMKSGFTKTQKLLKAIKQYMKEKRKPQKLWNLTVNYQPHLTLVKLKANKLQ